MNCSQNMSTQQQRELQSLQHEQYYDKEMVNMFHAFVQFILFLSCVCVFKHFCNLET